MSDVALDGFPVIIDVPVAWGEMDSFGHVNNIVYFRYFESARIAYFDAIDFRGSDGAIGPILASTQCRFRRPLTYPDQLRVGARITDLGTDRFTMQYRVHSRALADIAAEGSGIVVAYDYGAGMKAPLPVSVRRRVESLEPHLFTG